MKPKDKIRPADLIKKTQDMSQVDITPAEMEQAGGPRAVQRFYKLLPRIDEIKARYATGKFRQQLRVQQRAARNAQPVPEKHEDAISGEGVHMPYSKR